MEWHLCKSSGYFKVVVLHALSQGLTLNFLPFSLFGGICILLLASIVQIFFPFSEGFQLALAIGGVIIFSGYIIFDTYLIFNRYSPEDYIMASVSLYMDIINLFIRILQILSATQRD